MRGDNHVRGDEVGERAVSMFHVDVERFLERCRAEGFNEIDIMAIRALIGEAHDKARRPSPPSSTATTTPGTPTAIRRAGSSQRIQAIRLDHDPDSERDPDD